MLNIPYKDTRKLARDLLSHYKTLENVLDALVRELSNFKGLKERLALPIKVIKEVAKRYLKNKALKAEYLSSPQEVYYYLKYEMQNLPRETLKVIFLSSKSKGLDIEKLFEGTITESICYPRKIFAKTFEKSASSIILVHNHPSGKPTPSKEDAKFTKNLIIAGYLLQCKIVDHIITSKNGYYKWLKKEFLKI